MESKGPEVRIKLSRNETQPEKKQPKTPSGLRRAYTTFASVSRRAGRRMRLRGLKEKMTPEQDRQNDSQEAPKIRSVDELDLFSRSHVQVPMDTAKTFSSRSSFRRVFISLSPPRQNFFEFNFTRNQEPEVYT